MSAAAALRVMLALFLLWGFLTGLNDILVPHFRLLFTLSYTRAALVPVTFFATCFVFAPIASVIIDRLGYRFTMIAGLVTMGAGALLFLPAAQMDAYGLFLAAIGIIGAGITILQAAAAPYIGFLGPREDAPSRFSLTLAFTSLGTMIAPLFGGWFILRAAVRVTQAANASVPSSAARWQALSVLRGPYLFIGFMLILVAVGVALCRLPRVKVSSDQSSMAGSFESVFRHRPLIFGAVTAFLYAGAEIGISSFLVNYLSQPEILGISRHSAALLATFYWGGAVVGRLFGWLALRRWRVETVLAIVAASAAVLISISVTAHGLISAASLLAVGLFNAMIVPIVVMLAISGLGPLTSRASSLMVAANIGAGLMPLALGTLADRIGVHHALAPVILCYGFVLFYAVRGCRGHLLRDKTEYRVLSDRNP